MNKAVGGTDTPRSELARISEQQGIDFPLQGIVEKLIIPLLCDV